MRFIEDFLRNLIETQLLSCKKSLRSLSEARRRREDPLVYSASKALTSRLRCAAAVSLDGKQLRCAMFGCVAPFLRQRILISFHLDLKRLKKT